MVDESEIIARAKAGDRRAFESILATYEKPVFNAAYRIVANREDAADITQSVFIKVYEKLGRYDPRHRFFSWVYRIAINEAINFAKRRSREVPLEGDFVSRQDNPVDHLARGERDELISGALTALKPDYRVVVVLKYFLDFTYKEIGEAVGIPEKTVKSRLFTARELLRETLIQRGYSR